MTDLSRDLRAQLANQFAFGKINVPAARIARHNPQVSIPFERWKLNRICFGSSLASALWRQLGSADDLHIHASRVRLRLQILRQWFGRIFP
jgi:hypothetical protein